MTYSRTCSSSSSGLYKEVKPRKCVSSISTDPLEMCDPTAGIRHAVRVPLSLADLPLKRIVATCSCRPPELADKESSSIPCVSKDSSRRVLVPARSRRSGIPRTR